MESKPMFYEGLGAYWRLTCFPKWGHLINQHQGGCMDEDAAGSLPNCHGMFAE